MATRYKPKQYKFVYFRCPKCRMISCMATASMFVTCGGRWCGVMSYYPKCEITQQEYERIWG